jgi:hypothetical protein
MPETDVHVAEVKALRTRGGNTRFVLVDDQGREFSTFREEIAAGLPSLEGRRARVRYHEERRGDYTNVYLDGVQPLEEPGGRGGTDPDEAAWRTAVEAAPFLLSRDERDREVSPDELFERLRPFKELVADDITRESDDDGEP